MSNTIFNLVFMFILVIFTLTVHEFSHVLMARFLGDRTGQKKGRLTLNPLKHIDLFWTIMFPAITLIISFIFPIPMFAAGKPAPYNSRFLKRKFFGNSLSRKTAECLVALAGPISNLILAFFIAFVVSRNLNSNLNLFLNSFISLNISLFLFNLIPIPPLDGEKLLIVFLSRKAMSNYIFILNKFSWILFLIIIFFAGKPVKNIANLIHFSFLRLYA